MKNIAVLGSTGSIGTQTLDIIRNNKDKFSVAALTAHSNIDLLIQQIEEFKPKLAVVLDTEKYEELKKRVDKSVQIAVGVEGLSAAATLPEADIIVSAIVGIAGLIPTYSAVQKGKKIALANKETLVTAGNLMVSKAKETGSMLLPVDSEHSAIFQSIGCNPIKTVYKLILTASGGPFRSKSEQELKNVTLKDALKHPNWSMGKKITIDSATLMNKGLEVIEAKWLFDMPSEDIEVVVHPQSIIHSLVEYVDGAVMAQLGLPDMKVPIQYALTYPDRICIPGKRLSLTEIKSLDFYPPDKKKFPCLQLAYDSLANSSSHCIVLNSANEEAVKLFLEEKISFIQIAQLIEMVLEEHNTVNVASIDDIIQIDNWARRRINEIYLKRC